MSLETPPDEQSEESLKHGGRARERYERRKRLRQPQVKPSNRRQLDLPQRVRLPRMTIPRDGRVLLGAVAAVAFVVIVVFALGRLRNNPVSVQPNGLWVGTEWTYEDHSADDMLKLVQNLRAQKIGTIYAWVSYLQYDKTWRGQDKFDKVKAFVRQFKADYPESHLYGWISLPTNDESNTKTRIDDPALQQMVADFSKQVVTDFGFDGVYINAEPVWDGDQNFLALLQKVRTSVGATVPISAAIPPDWSPSNSDIPLPPLITPGTEWKKSYKQSVALLVDHMAVLAYQSGLSTTDDYAKWVAYQVKTYAQAIADLNTDTDLIIGIPTFDAEPPGHDPAVENIKSAVEGVRLGLQQAGDAARYVSGLAIYGWWTTDDTEWSDFQSAWINGK